MLLSAARSGDRAAADILGQWLDRWAGYWCRTHFQRGGHYRGVSPEDAAQDVAVAVLSGEAVFRPPPGVADEWALFGRWVWGICRHKCADTHRHLEARRTVLAEADPDLPDAEPGPEELALAAEQAREAARTVRRLLDRLGARSREVLLLRLAYDVDVADVARVVGTTPGCVRVTQARGLAQLRRRLGVAA